MHIDNARTNDTNKQIYVTNGTHNGVVYRPRDFKTGILFATWSFDLYRPSLRDPLSACIGHGNGFDTAEAAMDAAQKKSALA